MVLMGDVMVVERESWEGVTLAASAVL